MFVNENKKRLFERDFAAWGSDPPQAWRQEWAACSCQNCYDEYDMPACPVRDTFDRFPVDAGGRGLCLRLCQLKNKYAFRNPSGGDVIVIPDKIVQAIAKDILGSRNR